MNENFDIQMEMERRALKVAIQQLSETVGAKLISEDISFSCAESCTGGLFAAVMTEISGISLVFDRGLVTYSNKAKVEELGVSEDTLKKYGSVSEETAREMALGLHRVSGSRLCVSVTGIAGPLGGTSEKPVGLIYLGLLFDGTMICKKLYTQKTDRSWNRRLALLTMLQMIQAGIESDAK